MLLLVALMPWPAGRVATEVAARPDYASAILLTTLAVLSWLFFRACTTLHDVWCYFEILHLEGPLRPPNDAIQIVVVDLVSTALLAPPLWRAFGTRAVAAAFVVATPWFIATGTGTAFDFDRWLTRPISNSLWLFGGAIPLLFLMEACSLRDRLRARAPVAASKQSGSWYERLKQLFELVLYWPAKSAVPPLLLLTTIALAIRFHFYDARPAVSRRRQRRSPRSPCPARCC